MDFFKTERYMGTDIEIQIFDIFDEYTSEKLEIDGALAFEIFLKYEKEFSRFDMMSALSQLNQKRTLQVSDTFIDVLKKAQYFFTLTEGYFNPCVSVKNL